MSKAVAPNADAEAEFRHYISWYEREGEALGERLWEEIQAAIDLISNHPAIGEVVRRVRVPQTVRRIPLRHFPFLLIYREFDEYLEVVALAHTSRRASYWRDRLR